VEVVGHFNPMCFQSVCVGIETGCKVVHDLTSDRSLIITIGEPNAWVNHDPDVFGAGEVCNHTISAMLNPMISSNFNECH
jgi:hypothetical protein